ncbi:uncharacterized protein LOC131146795 [Malania oleifera]|uniref:uncharacterized protein LOC131146795 n=1 Tax=Malania oleifera TaxID=397392 RepID=UPI0025ADF9D0|nr:uncharacterized protein LOC131146795 [Malania oleifera]
MMKVRKMGSRKASMLVRCLKAPFKALAKAGDLYIKGMTECAGRLSNSSAMGCPTGQPMDLPRSFSVSSSSCRQGGGADEELAELVRAASKRSVVPQLPPDAAGDYEQMRRSCSAAIGRIDEEKPCEFGEDDVKVKAVAYPRSRSYASHKRLL